MIIKEKEREQHAIGKTVWEGQAVCKLVKPPHVTTEADS
jgi:hypothetical protein